jgi:hypothetical protein
MPIRGAETEKVAGFQTTHRINQKSIFIDGISERNITARFFQIQLLTNSHACHVDMKYTQQHLRQISVDFRKMKRPRL